MEEEVEANCAEERGIGRKIQWELMESSLTTIGPHYMEIKEPTTAPIGKSISHDPHVPLHFRHVGNTTHIEDVLLLDIPTLYDSSLSL